MGPGVYISCPKTGWSDGSHIENGNSEVCNGQRVGTSCCDYPVLVLGNMHCWVHLLYDMVLIPECHCIWDLVNFCLLHVYINFFSSILSNEWKFGHSWKLRRIAPHLPQYMYLPLLSRWHPRTPSGYQLHLLWHLRLQLLPATMPPKVPIFMKKVSPLLLLT